MMYAAYITLHETSPDVTLQYEVFIIGENGATVKEALLNLAQEVQTKSDMELASRNGDEIRFGVYCVSGIEANGRTARLSGETTFRKRNCLKEGEGPQAYEPQQEEPN